MSERESTIVTVAQKALAKFFWGRCEVTRVAAVALAIFSALTLSLARSAQAGEIYPEGSAALLGGAEWERHLSAELSVGFANTDVGILTRCAWGPWAGIDLEFRRQFASETAGTDWAFETPLHLGTGQGWFAAPTTGLRHLSGNLYWPLGLQVYVGLGPLGVWTQYEALVPLSSAAKSAGRAMALARVQLETLVAETRSIRSILGLRIESLEQSSVASKFNWLLVTGTRF